MKKISIIIKNFDDISVILSLTKTQCKSCQFEYFLVDNTIKNIEKILPENIKTTNEPDVKSAIQHASGEYVMIVNSGDIFIPNAFISIMKMIDISGADIIHFNSDNHDDKTGPIKNLFNYVFNKQDIMSFAFNYLSEFCFKRELIQKTCTDKNFFLFNVLINTRDMMSTQQCFVIHSNQKTQSIDDTIDIVDNFATIEKYFSSKFWVKYFRIIIPKIIKTSIQKNDKTSFVHFCKKIPIKFVPMRYKIIFFIFKITNK